MPDARDAALEEAALLLDDWARDWRITASRADGHEREFARHQAQTLEKAARKVRELKGARK